MIFELPNLGISISIFVKTLKQVLIMDMDHGFRPKNLYPVRKFQLLLVAA